MQPECKWCSSDKVYICKTCMQHCCADHSQSVQGKTLVFQLCAQCYGALWQAQCALVDDFVQGMMP